MKVLHIAPHLGGGVGNAHATLAESIRGAPSPDAIEHAYILLEPPRDVVYTDRLRAVGCPLHIGLNLAEIAALAADADIVQLEWWNHPRLYDALVANTLPALRLAAWLHISGIVAPLVPRAFVELVDQTMFTSPCSFGAANLRAPILARPDSFHVVNSGFGFPTGRHRARAPGRPLRFGYLGTLDFIKMHPDFFDFIDAIDADISVHLWGHWDPEGEVAKRAAAMRAPSRVTFEGYTADPLAVLSQLDVFIYLLAPDHYGTAENALVEAMSAGAVPIVFANAAEAYIVKDRQTGFIVETRHQLGALVESIIREPEQLDPIRSLAMIEAERSHSPDASARTLAMIYGELMRQPKRQRDFASALGLDARSWFLSSLSDAQPEEKLGERLLSHVTSKGSLGHFRSCFPQDQSLLSLEARAR